MNRDPRGYYAALHVTPDATAAEIQHAFRALMRLRHPDVDAAVRRPDRVPGTTKGTKRGASWSPSRSCGIPDPGPSMTRRQRRPGPGRTAPGGREIPVRHHRQERPVLRVTPVRWERGPL